MRHFYLTGLFTVIVYHFSEAQWPGMQVKQIISTENRLYSLTLAHTNKDSFQDLVGLPADPFNSVIIYSGSKEGNFAFSHAFQKDENYRVLEKGDLDADGIDDLVISGYWKNGFSIFWGNENGSPVQGQHYDLTGHGKNIKLVDINKDGNVDIVALSGGSGQPITMHLFYGNRTRTLTAGGIYACSLHTDRQITIADKDLNGLPDVMVSSSFPWFVIFYQQSNGSFIPRYWPYEIEIPFPSYHLADLNNDTRQDIIASYFDKGFRFYAGMKDTLFSEQYIEFNTEISPSRIFYADLNKDGFIDLVTDNQSAEYETTNTMYYLLGKGDFTFEQPQAIVLPSSVERFIVEDFNSDGYPDIIAFCTGVGIVTIANQGMVTGVEDDESSMQVFPNPFTNYIHLDFQNDQTQVTFYESSGKAIKTITAEGETDVNTTTWPAGLYIMRAVDGHQKAINSKLIKR